jgi:hypothetical protein
MMVVRGRPSGRTDSNLFAVFTPVAQEAEAGAESVTMLDKLAVAI